MSCFQEEPLTDERGREIGKRGALARNRNEVWRDSVSSGR